MTQEIPLAAPTPVDAEEHLLDIGRMTKTELRLKYQSTYSSWTNMKSRCRDGQYSFAPEFEEFGSFLGLVGPRPSPEHTLDRIDFNDPLYGPGRVRWLDKKGQANNRSSTIFLTVGTETKPLTVWAEDTNQRTDTLRDRKQKGWSDHEVVYGKRQESWPPAQPWDWRPWPDDPEKQKFWEALYQEQGERKEYRIDFFIRILVANAASEENFVIGNEMDENPAIAAKVEVANQRLDEINARLAWARAKRKELYALITKFGQPPHWRGPTRFPPIDGSYRR